MTAFEELDKERLKSIKKQAEYNKQLSFEEKFVIAMRHLEGLRQLKIKARRIPDEKI